MEPQAHASGVLRNEARSTAPRETRLTQTGASAFARARPTQRKLGHGFRERCTYRGRRFRTLNVLDEGVREGLAIEIDTSLPAARVVRTLEQVGEWRGFPKALRVDNGPEFIAQELADWCSKREIDLRFIEPGEPNQNAYIERFNGTYRQEVLNAYLFEDLDQVREISSQWLRIYNEERPHDALGSLPPALYREQVVAAKNSTSECLLDGGAYACTQKI